MRLLPRNKTLFAWDARYGSYQLRTIGARIARSEDLTKGSHPVIIRPSRQTNSPDRSPSKGALYKPAVS